jgi:hypothetical protein
MDATIRISAIAPADRKTWEVLARNYKASQGRHANPAEYEQAWQRLLARDHVCGLVARLEGELVGFSHYLFHASTWTPEVCYLQDLGSYAEA